MLTRYAIYLNLGAILTAILVLTGIVSSAFEYIKSRDEAVAAQHQLQYDNSANELERMRARVKARRDE